MSNTKHFNDFIKDARELLDDFERDYIENHNKNPDVYPLEFSSENEGIWWEMLQEHDINEN